MENRITSFALMPGHVLAGSGGTVFCRTGMDALLFPLSLLPFTCTQMPQDWSECGAFLEDLGWIQLTWPLVWHNIGIS